jgi:hypothetical protein
MTSLSFAHQASEVTEARWSLPLLLQLDWKRLHELVSMLLHRAGFMAEVGWIRPDAGVMLSVTHPAKGGRTDALVQCPSWVGQMVGLSDVKELFNAVLQEGASRGIFATPGGFSDEARQFAKMRPIELIDGPAMLRTILRMTEEEQSYYLRMATIGQYTVPSCPSCSKKLELSDDTGAAFDGLNRDVVFKESEMVGSEVHCRTLTVRAGAEVLFMHPVFAHEVVIQGRATGNLTVQGKLTITAGGLLSGMVAARAIKLDEKGMLEAEARILNAAEVVPVRAAPVHQIWRCSSWPRCRGQLPLR